MKIIIDTTKNIVSKIILLSIFGVLLVAVVSYARGYRFNFQEGTVSSTGIISVNSTPRGAKVYINGKLNGATDTNITLPFGKYEVEVKKEGYTSWKKNVTLQGEIVMSLNAVLFSKNPSLTPLTNLGVIRAHSVGNTNKVILVSKAGSQETDGIYLFESSGNPVSIFPPLKLLVSGSLIPDGLDMAQATFIYGPRYRQAILNIPLAGDTKEEASSSYLISLDEENPELFDITTSVTEITNKWHEERNHEMAKIIETLPKAFQPIATESFQIISLSPDEKKLMYVAKTAATLPPIITPPLIGANQSKETRTLEKGRVYVYDKKEDKNFIIPVNLELTFSNKSVPTQVPTRAASASTSIATPLSNLLDEQVESKVLEHIAWYPTSDYIVVKEQKSITVMQYDGTNKETVYAGPFDGTFFGVSPDWNLMVVINLNEQNNSYGDLYSIGIR